MDFFSTTPESPETRRLKETLMRRNLLDNQLQGIGKVFFQSNAGGVGTKERFESTLYQIDKAHQDLINFAKQYLPDNVIRNILINEKLECKLKILESENDKLRTEKLHQKQYFITIIAERAREFYEGETKAEQRYSGLATYCKSLEEEIKHFQAQMQRVNNVSIDNPNTADTRIQRQEETLKAQNDLINDLKRELSNCKANEQTKLQSALQELQNEIQRFQTTFNQREQQFQQLYQEHQTLQKHMSMLGQNFKREYLNLEEAVKKTLTLAENKAEAPEIQNKGESKQNYKGTETKRVFHKVKDDGSGKNAEALKTTFIFGENKEEVPKSQNKGEGQGKYKGTETKREFQEVSDDGSGKNPQVTKTTFTFGENKEEVPECQYK